MILRGSEYATTCIQIIWQKYIEHLCLVAGPFSEAGHHASYGPWKLRARKQTPCLYVASYCFGAAIFHVVANQTYSPLLLIHLMLRLFWLCCYRGNMSSTLVLYVERANSGDSKKKTTPAKLCLGSGSYAQHDARFDLISWISIQSDGTLGLWFRWNVEAVICRHITQMSTDVETELIKSFQQMKIKFRILQAWYRWYQILIYSCPAGSNNICIWSLKRD